jgi:hypothetical protein
MFLHPYCGVWSKGHFRSFEKQLKAMKHLNYTTTIHGEDVINPFIYKDVCGVFYCAKMAAVGT